MDEDRPTKTLADYLVIAVSPALLIVLVHSICFFLVDVFLRGEAVGGVRWVLFWFILAVVLIARIGIEQGDTQAMVYGLLLAGVTWIYLATLQQTAVFGAILLGVVWFTAHKLTCNCTLVDEEADASGQGLLASLRRWPRWFKKEPAPEPTPPAPAKPVRGVAAPAKKKRWSGSQAPGVWLIYYSVAALPLFGLGQMLLPAADLAARHRAFVYLFLYLAAALGLLVITSFLGLRRYLRQRYLVMPGNIAFGWIQIGVIAAAIVLTASLLLPRPGAGEAWTALRHQVDYQLRRASEYAARFNPHGKGAGRAGDQTTGSKPSQDQSQSGQSPNANPNESKGASDQGQKPSASDHGKSPGPEGSSQTERNLPSLSPPAASIFGWIKGLFYLAVVIVAGWLLYRYREVVMAFLRGMAAAIRSLLADLLGLFSRSAAKPEVGRKKAEVVPFRMLKNPFLTGADRIWPPEELIVHSYKALQSWAAESEAPEGSPQTPREFCRQIETELPDAKAALEHLAFLYGNVAYGGAVPANYQPEQLRLLWDHMASPRAKPRAPESEAGVLAGN